MMDPTLIAPDTNSSPHICVPLYRAADGKQARCWCGRDCRDDPLLRDNVVQLHPAVRRDKAAG